MKIVIFDILFLSSLIAVYPQNDKVQDDFNIQLQDSKLVVHDKEDNLVFQKSFGNPAEIVVDLDGDENSEYLIKDFFQQDNVVNFIIYVFNTLSSFTLVDSILSGQFEPYQTISDELNIPILVTGNAKFNQFASSDQINITIPIDCWRYDENGIYSVNEELYEPFISENENLIPLVENYFKQYPKNCESSGKIKAAIASVYANYINAGESSLAHQFLKKFYFCEDLNKFQNKLNELLQGFEQ